MGIRAQIAALGALVFGSSLAPSALADSLDPALSRLVLDSRCHTDRGQIVDGTGTRSLIAAEYERNGLPGRNGLCAPDSAAFRKLVNQWGFALAPNSMFPARTTGFGGFEFSLQASYTAIDSDADYWKQGTQGERDASTGSAVLEGSPPGLISVYSLNIRKNLAFGFETMANVGFVPGSNIINGGADVRLSLLEGFRTGIGGAFPDIAAGAGIRTITGTDQMQLTTVALDARISKPIPIADQSVLTPIVGFQYVWIFGRSGLIDLTPGTDPLGYCGFAGADLPRTGSNDRGTTFDGQPVCSGGTVLDFNNNVVFDKADLERQRLVFALDYRYELLNTGVQFITDMIDPANAQNSDQDKVDLATCKAGSDECTSMPRQWQLSFELGVSF